MPQSAEREATLPWSVHTDRNGRTRLAIVPKRKDVPAGTLLSILEQAGLTREEFLELI